MSLARKKVYMNSALPIALSGILWMSLIAFHAFVWQNNAMRSASAIYFFAGALFTIGETMLCYWLYSDWVKRKPTPDMGRMLAWTLALAVAFALLIIFQGKGWILLFGSDKIELFFFAFDKKRIFDFWCIICFPSILILLRDTIKRKDCVNNRLYAAIIIISFTLMGIFLYAGKSIYLFEMGLLNLISVGSFVKSISENSGKRRRVGRAMGIVLLYLIFWISLLCLLREPEQDFSSYMYGGDREQIFFGGWGEVTIYIILLGAFLYMMHWFLAPKYKEHKTLYWIYQAAFVNLVFRAAAGIIYSFGMIPIPVALPFAGAVGWKLDGMCVALLMYSHIENCKIEPVLNVYSDIMRINVSELLNKYVKGSMYSIEVIDCDMDHDFVICSLKSLKTKEEVSVIPVFECSMKEKKFIICSRKEQPYREIVVLEKSAFQSTEGDVRNVRYLEADKEAAEMVEGCYKSAILLSLKKGSILDSAQTILSDVIWKEKKDGER